ncbi:MAG: ABC transporter substrate-binding protein [Chitinivorax sp.]
MKKQLFRVSAVALALALSGAGSSALAAGNEIVVGQSVALTGPLAEVGKDFSAAMKAYFDYVNAKGGANGKQIKLIVKDDASVPAKSFQNAQALINENVDVLAGFTGTPNVALLVRTKTLQKNNIALVGPLTGADSLRAAHGTEEHKAEQGNYQLGADTMTEGHIPQLFHVRAGYSDEARKIVKQAVSLGMQKIGVLYSDDAFGKTGLAAINEALKEHKLQLASKGIYSAKTGDISDAVKNISAARPQAVIMLANTTPAGNFIKQYRQIDPGAQLFALSTVSARTLVKNIGVQGMAHGVGISQVMPMPTNSLTPLSKEHQKIMAEYAPKTPLSYLTMEGHIVAKIITEAVRRGGTSRAGMFTGLEALKGYDAGGFYVNFGPGERRGSKYVDVTVIGANGDLMR